MPHSFWLLQENPNLENFLWASVGLVFSNLKILIRRTASFVLVLILRALKMLSGSASGFRVLRALG